MTDCCGGAHTFRWICKRASVTAFIVTAAPTVAHLRQHCECLRARCREATTWASSESVHQLLDEPVRRALGVVSTMSWPRPVSAHSAPTRRTNPGNCGLPQRHEVAPCPLGAPVSRKAAQERALAAATVMRATINCAMFVLHTLYRRVRSLQSPSCARCRHHIPPSPRRRRRRPRAP